jgi:hypothetical protein
MGELIPEQVKVGNPQLCLYVRLGNINIRIHRDITGEMWFGVGGRCLTSMMSNG